MSKEPLDALSVLTREAMRLCAERDALLNRIAVLEADNRQLDANWKGTNNQREALLKALRKASAELAFNHVAKAFEVLNDGIQAAERKSGEGGA